MSKVREVGNEPKAVAVTSGRQTKDLKIRQILKDDSIYLGALTAATIVMLIGDLEKLSENPDITKEDVSSVLKKHSVEIPTDEKLEKIALDLKTLSSCQDDNNNTSNENLTVPAVHRPELYGELYLSEGIRLRTIIDGGKRIIDYFQEHMTENDLEYVNPANRGEGGYIELRKTPLFSYATRQIELNDFAMDPNNALFNKVAWTLFSHESLFSDCFKQMNSRGSVDSEIFCNWLAKITAHLKDKPDWADTEKLKTSERVSLKEASLIYQKVLTKVLAPLGIFPIPTGYGPSLGLSIDALTTEIETPAKNKVTVYSTYTPYGFMGGSRALGDIIILPIESRISRERDHENFSLWWEDYCKGQQWPSIEKKSGLIRSWVEMHTFGPLSLEDADKLHTTETLIEDLCRLDAIKYVEKKLNREINVMSPEDNVEAAKTLLADDTTDNGGFSLKKELQRYQETPNKYCNLAATILKINALLGAMEISPCASFTFIRCLAEKVSRDRLRKFRRLDSDYDAMVDFLITRMFAIELFNKDTFDKSIWLPYLQENLKDQDSIHKFNSIVQETAKKIRLRRLSKA